MKLEIGKLYHCISYISALKRNFFGEYKNIRAGDILLYVKTMNVWNGYYNDFYLFIDKDGDRLVLERWQFGCLKRV